MGTVQPFLVLSVCLMLAHLASGGEEEKGSFIPKVPLRYEKDFTSQKWALTEWKEGDRPYLKDLAKREAWYKEKHGENWKGKIYQWGRDKTVAKYIMSPGVWAFEVYWMEDMLKHFQPRTPQKGKSAEPNPRVYSLGGGETVTDLYILAPYGFIHFNPATKKAKYFGLDVSKQYPWYP